MANPAFIAYKDGVPLSRFLFSATAMADADAAAGPNGFVYIDSNITLSSDVSGLVAFWVGAGGIITRGAHSISFGRFWAPDEMSVFDKTGTGTVSFSPTVTSSLRWFSPTADGVTDDTLAVNAWNNSSHLRFAPSGRYATSKITVNIFGPQFGTRALLGAGKERTTFVSLAGDHIFEFSTATNIIDFEMGGFSGHGTSGYLVSFTSAIQDSFQNYFHDLYAENITGIVSDNHGMGGVLFSTTFVRLESSGCIGNSIDLTLDNTSALVDCLIHGAAVGFWGYRLRSGGQMVRCNGIDAGWGGCLLGSKIGTTTITGVTGGTITIAADSINAECQVQMENCNIEGALLVCVVRSGNVVKIDSKTTFISAPNVTCAGLVLDLGTQSAETLGFIENYDRLFVLSSGASWSNGAPINAFDNEPRFRKIISSAANGGLVSFYDAATTAMRTIAADCLLQFGSNLLSSSDGYAASRFLLAPALTIAQLYGYSQKDGNQVWCTDLEGGPELLTFNATSAVFERISGTSRHGNLATTGAVSLVSLSNASIQDFSGVTLTGDTTVSVSSVGRYTGLFFRIVSPASLGGHVFNVALTAGNKSLTANQWIDVQWNGAALVQIAGASLL